MHWIVATRMWQRIVTRVVSNGDSDTGIRSDSAVVASLSLVTCGGHWLLAAIWMWWAHWAAGGQRRLECCGYIDEAAGDNVVGGDSDADHAVASGHSDAVATRMPYLGTVQQRLGCGGRP